MDDTEEEMTLSHPIRPMNPFTVSGWFDIISWSLRLLRMLERVGIDDFIRGLRIGAVVQGIGRGPAGLGQRFFTTSDASHSMTVADYTHHTGAKEKVFVQITRHDEPSNVRNYATRYGSTGVVRITPVREYLEEYLRYYALDVYYRNVVGLEGTPDEQVLNQAILDSAKKLAKEGIKFETDVTRFVGMAHPSLGGALWMTGHAISTVGASLGFKSFTSSLATSPVPSARHQGYGYCSEFVANAFYAAKLFDSHGYHGPSVLTPAHFSPEYEPDCTTGENVIRFLPWRRPGVHGLGPAVYL